MADYTTHVTTSTVLGVGYGAAAYLLGDVPLPACVLAGGLCGVSGMLPDLDSESGVPVREGSAFAAAVVPMLMIDRFQHLGWTSEMMALAGGGIYLTIRIMLPFLLGKFSKHRGMWHSLPACLIAGLAAFLICSGPSLGIRCFKAGGVMLGFMSHLLLDEFYSFEVRRGRLRVKHSFGTAIKFFSKNPWANFSTYGKLVALLVLAVGDPLLMEHYHMHPTDEAHRTAEKIQETINNALR
ncbi:MAG: metal-dependent hydrolase [Planctomycetales bacterium]|nr:metal-dependent hydrolase [Planctomycetales bacterium]